MAEEKKTSWRLCIAAAAAPPIVICGYLLLSRWALSWFTSWSDWLAIGLSTALGLVAVFKLPLPLNWRLGIGMLYCPLCALVLAYLSLVFVCAFFGDCL